MSDEQQTDPTEQQEPSQVEESADDTLGDAGKKALQAEREARKAEAKRAKELEAELNQLREASMSEQERAIEQARREAADEARTAVLGDVNKRLFAAELRAQAAGKLANPGLLANPDVALGLLQLDAIPVTETGDIDSEAISERLTSFLEENQNLRASAMQPGDADQGARTPVPERVDMDALIRRSLLT
jgi:hypothetical protein